MKRFYTFIIVVLAFAANAQNHNNWVRHSQSDGIIYGEFNSEYDFLINVAKDFYSKNEFQKSVSFYLMADSVSALKDDALVGLMNAYYHLYDYKNCIAAGDRLSENFDETASLTNRQLGYGILSNCYHFTEDYGHAIIYYNRYLIISDEDRHATAWEKFMLGKSYYELGDMMEMKHNSLTAVMDLCMFFGVTFDDIWNGEVKSEELGVMLYYISMMLRRCADGKIDADAAMMLSMHCGLDEAAEYIKTHKVSENPYKSVVFAKDKNKKPSPKK